MKPAIVLLVTGVLGSASVVWMDHLGIQCVILFLGLNFICLGMAYLFHASNVWLKRTDGSINPISYVVFAPLHCLNWVSFHISRWFTREPPLSQVEPNLWLGRRIRANEEQLLPGRDQLAVLDLTSEFAETRAARTIRYLNLPVLDRSAPGRAQLDRAIDFIGMHIHERPVFVHCALGHGRSATVVAAWLLRNDRTLSIESGLDRLKTVRRHVNLSPEQRSLLESVLAEWRNL